MKEGREGLQREIEWKTERGRVREEQFQSFSLFPSLQCSDLEIPHHSIDSSPPRARLTDFSSDSSRSWIFLSLPRLSYRRPSNRTRISERYRLQIRHRRIHPPVWSPDLAFLEFFYWFYWIPFWNAFLGALDPGNRSLRGFFWFRRVLWRFWEVDSRILERVTRFVAVLMDLWGVTEI